MAKKNVPEPLLVFCVFCDKWNDRPVVYFATPEDWKTRGYQSDCISGEAGELIDKLARKYRLSNLMGSTYECYCSADSKEIIAFLSKEPGVVFDKKFALRMKRDIGGVID